MVDFIKRLDPSWIRGTIAVIFSVTLVTGFFQGIVPVDVLKDMSLIAVSFYFAKAGGGQSNTGKG